MLPEKRCDRSLASYASASGRIPRKTAAGRRSRGAEQRTVPYQPARGRAPQPRSRLSRCSCSCSVVPGDAATVQLFPYGTGAVPVPYSGAVLEFNIDLLGTVPEYYCTCSLVDSTVYKQSNCMHNASFATHHSVHCSVYGVGSAPYSTI